MKKLFLLFVFALMLVGCTPVKKTTNEEALAIANNEYVLLEIENLQAQLERGEVTEKYAQEKLKQILKERQRLNSGDTEVILEKIKEQDPMLEKGLAEMIQRRQMIAEPSEK